MSLQTELNDRRRDIHTDAYPMSIGELINIYRDGELDVHPEFQRFFRWTPSQKSRWIESIMLGIPLPPIFVAQSPEGIWDVVDGLQRLSTIFQFTGHLKDEDGKLIPPLTLEATKYLPSFKGKRYSDPHDPSRSLTTEQQRYFKRSKLNLQIVLRESDPDTKYELFQRLNTGGTSLSDQEVRNCMLISINRDFYSWLEELNEYEPFQECIPITERLVNERYDMELALRFVIFRKMELGQMPDYGTAVGEFITERTRRIAQDPEFNRDREGEAFQRTFDLLAEALEENAFRKYDSSRQRFIGRFLVSAFEVIALGIGWNYPEFVDAVTPEQLKELVCSQVWSDPSFVTSPGVAAATRLPMTLELGRRLFRP